MGILNRISTLLKSNMNSALDKVSDPGKHIDQLVREMEDEAKKARGEVQTSIAAEKRMKQRVEALAKDAGEWEKRAERALVAGDEGLAREALVRKAEIDEQREAAERAFKEQGAYATQLTQALKGLDQKVKEAKLRKETLKAQARAQKSRDTGADTSAFDRFNKLETQADVMEAELSLSDELAADRHEDAHSVEVERKLADLAKNNDLDEKLAALKAKIKKPE